MLSQGVTPSKHVSMNLCMYGGVGIAMVLVPRDLTEYASDDDHGGLQWRNVRIRVFWTGSL